MMSLLPLNTLSEAGCLFIEARFLGNPGQIISQIGLTVDAPNTSIAVFSRTSGVLLVAGVGSFFAYRVASNLLGNRFVWECLDARTFDQIPTADRRLLYSFNEEEEDEENEEGRQNRIRRENEQDSRSVRSMSQISLSRMNRARRSTRHMKGLLGSLNEGRKNAGIVSRQSSRSIRSGLSNSQMSIPFSSASSMKSASFRIVWEGSQPAWDDSDMAPQTSGQGQTQPSVLCRLGHVPSTSSFLMRDGEDLQSVGDLCSVFNDVMSVTSCVETHDPLLDEEYEDDETEEKEGIWQKCSADNQKYMYQSFALDPSETGSDNDGSPDHSNAIEMSDVPGTSQPDADANDNLMIKSQNSKRSNGRSMYDSAIGGEISSEDGSTYLEHSNRIYSLQEGDNISIIAPSCASLEWCDDISKQHVIGGLTFNEEGSPLRLRKLNLDWDMDSEYGRAVSVSSSCNMDVNTLHAPRTSRDLMVMTCEMFQPYSPPFKDIQTMYHKRRLKRVGLTSPSDSTISLFIHSTLYHKCSLLREISWKTIEKRFDATLNECDFMRKWPSYSEKMMRADMKELHDLASNPSVFAITENHIKAYEVMLVLEAKRAYDERLAGLFCENWFNVNSPADVMKLLNQSQLPQQILWNLICRISCVQIEIVDARSLSEKTKFDRFSSPSPIPTRTLFWIRLGAIPSPLFYIPDDE